MKKNADSIKAEMRVARRTWPELEGPRLTDLRSLLVTYKFSASRGDIIRIDDHWFVTHSGLLQLACRRRCCGIETSLLQEASDPALGRWIFKATVYKSQQSKGFVGYGDAEPCNVSPKVRGAELRVAETRAVNRALRKAYGIGICSVEELAAPSGSCGNEHATKARRRNESNNSQPRLKDKLCLLIRHHNLDPMLVKAYAAHFCGTESLSGASRELVESFIAHLEKEAREDRDGLLCKLNSFSQPVEVHS